MWRLAVVLLVATIVAFLAVSWYSLLVPGDVGP
jgi:hypothetical protein